MLCNSTLSKMSAGYKNRSKVQYIQRLYNWKLILKRASRKYYFRTVKNVLNGRY